MKPKPKVEEKAPKRIDYCLVKVGAGGQEEIVPGTQVKDFDEILELAEFYDLKTDQYHRIQRVKVY